MKKLFKICVLFIALMAVPAFLFAGGETDGQSGAVQKIQKAGKLVMGTEAQYAPYEFKDKDANIVGCDIYIAEKIAEALGVELEVVDMAFDGIIPAVQSGQVDVGIAAFTNTPERAQVIDFSSIYEESLQYLVVQAGKEDVYTSADALKGLKVGAQRGTIQSQLIMKALPDSELFELAKYPELSIEVQNGNIAGFVLDFYTMEPRFQADSPAHERREPEIPALKDGLPVDPENMGAGHHLSAIQGECEFSAFLRSEFAPPEGKARRVFASPFGSRDFDFLRLAFACFGQGNRNFPRVEFGHAVVVPQKPVAPGRIQHRQRCLRIDLNQTPRKVSDVQGAVLEFPQSEQCLIRRRVEGYPGGAEIVFLLKEAAPRDLSQKPFSRFIEKAQCFLRLVQADGNSGKPDDKVFRRFFDVRLQRLVFSEDEFLFLAERKFRLHPHPDGIAGQTGNFQKSAVGKLKITALAIDGICGNSSCHD